MVLRNLFAPNDEEVGTIDDFAEFHYHDNNLVRIELINQSIDRSISK